MNRKEKPSGKLSKKLKENLTNKFFHLSPDKLYLKQMNDKWDYTDPTNTGIAFYRSGQENIFKQGLYLYEVVLSAEIVGKTVKAGKKKILLAEADDPALKKYGGFYSEKRAEGRTGKKQIAALIFLGIVRVNSGVIDAVNPEKSEALLQFVKTIKHRVTAQNTSFLYPAIQKGDYLVWLIDDGVYYIHDRSGVGDFLAELFEDSSILVLDIEESSYSLVVLEEARKYKVVINGKDFSFSSYVFEDDWVEKEDCDSLTIYKKIFASPFTTSTEFPDFVGKVPDLFKIFY